MISAKIATLDLLKNIYFKIRIMTSYFMFITSPTTFDHVDPITL